MAGRDFKGNIRTANFVTRFSCLGEQCEDTCCRGWGMQVDETTQELFRKEAPELLDALTTGEAEHVMKRDSKTDYCVKFSNGLCSIHKEKGPRFLGDACHFYPRITRKLGDEPHMSASLSCPEIARLALYGSGDMFQYHPQKGDRLPDSVADYKPEGMATAEAVAVMEAFQQYVLNAATPERAVAVLMNVAQSLELIEAKNWGQAAPLYLKIAESRLPKPEGHESDDYRLLNILVGLLKAAKKSSRPRLEEVIAQMERALKVRIDREGLQIISETGSLDAHEVLHARWHKASAGVLAPVLKRWVAAQLSMASFPFAGFGRTLKERAVIIGVRYATLKLALMAYMDNKGKPPEEAVVVLAAQSLSRFMDHLADPAFSMMAYEEAGWTKEPRLRALIGDR